MHPQKYRSLVGCADPMIVLLREIDGALDHTDYACVIDQGCYRSIGLFPRFDDRFPAGRGTDVVLDKDGIFTQFNCECRALFGLNIGHDDFRTIADKGASRSSAHALCCPGDYCHFAFQPIHNHYPFTVLKVITLLQPGIKSLTSKFCWAFFKEGGATLMGIRSIQNKANHRLFVGQCSGERHILPVGKIAF